MVTKKTVKPPPVLRDVIKAIRKEMGWTQEEMEQALKLPGQEVQRAEKADAINWIKHWNFFLKILPLCLKLDLIGERELLSDPRHDTKTDNSDNPTRKIKSHHGQKDDDDGTTA